MNNKPNPEEPIRKTNILATLFLLAFIAATVACVAVAALRLI